MRKIAISLTKGSVSKTTTAVNLAAGLALNGARVLLVDTYIQGPAGFMLGILPEVGLAEVLSGNKKPHNVLVEARNRLWLLADGGASAGER